MGDNKIKTIAVSGSGGMIGSYLTHYFKRSGIKIYPLGRHHFTDGGRDELSSFIDRADAVINLAGAPINHRWTDNYKKELFESRINTTRKIVEAINGVENKPRVFCSASAVGYYPSSGCHTERESVKGSGFLSDLCEAWEREAFRAQPAVRTAVMRFGLVLSPAGGVLTTFRVPTLFKVTPVLGRGDQYFPWIDIRDLTGALQLILESKSLDGIFNFVAPQVITNRQFSEAMAIARRSWVKVNIPGFVFRAALGEAASMVISGQCVLPERLLQAGYEYRSPDIATFFRDMNGR